MTERTSRMTISEILQEIRTLIGVYIPHGGLTEEVDELERRMQVTQEEPKADASGYYVACIVAGSPVAHYVSDWDAERTPTGPDFSVETTTNPRQARLFTEKRHARSACVLVNKTHMSTIGVFAVRSTS